jgi:hypothetical protein
MFHFFILGSSKVNGKMQKKSWELFKDRRMKMERCKKDPLQYSRIVEG